MTAGAPFGSSASNRRSLAAMIVLDRRMVVHVVAAEIGEAAGGKPHAVEPALVEPVAGGLHRGVGDAGIREFAQQLVQRDRIGRGQRAVFVAAAARRRRSCRCSRPHGRPAPRSGG